MMKKVSLFAIVALGTLLLPCRLSSKVVLESVFSDNMVLQRNATVRIWGKAFPPVLSGRTTGSREQNK